MDAPLNSNRTVPTVLMSNLTIRPDTMVRVKEEVMDEVEEIHLTSPQDFLSALNLHQPSSSLSDNKEMMFSGNLDQSIPSTSNGDNSGSKSPTIDSDVDSFCFPNKRQQTNKPGQLMPTLKHVINSFHYLEGCSDQLVRSFLNKLSHDIRYLAKCSPPPSSTVVIDGFQIDCYDTLRMCNTASKFALIDYINRNYIDKAKKKPFVSSTPVIKTKQHKVDKLKKIQRVQHYKTKKLQSAQQQQQQHRPKRRRSSKIMPNSDVVTMMPDSIKQSFVRVSSRGRAIKPATKLKENVSDFLEKEERYLNFLLNKRNRQSNQVSKRLKSSDPNHYQTNTSTTAAAESFEFIDRSSQNQCCSVSKRNDTCDDSLSVSVDDTCEAIIDESNDDEQNFLNDNCDNDDVEEIFDDEISSDEENEFVFKENEYISGKVFPRLVQYDNWKYFMKLDGVPAVFELKEDCNWKNCDDAKFHRSVKDALQEKVWKNVSVKCQHHKLILPEWFEQVDLIFNKVVDKTWNSVSKINLVPVDITKINSKLKGVARKRLDHCPSSKEWLFDDYENSKYDYPSQLTSEPVNVDVKVEEEDNVVEITNANTEDSITNNINIVNVEIDDNVSSANKNLKDKAEYTSSTVNDTGKSKVFENEEKCLKQALVNIPIIKVNKLPDSSALTKNSFGCKKIANVSNLVKNDNDGRYRMGNMPLSQKSKCIQLSKKDFISKINLSLGLLNKQNASLHRRNSTDVKCVEGKIELSTENSKQMSENNIRSDSKNPVGQESKLKKLLNNYSKLENINKNEMSQKIIVKDANSIISPDSVPGTQTMLNRFNKILNINDVKDDADQTKVNLLVPHLNNLKNRISSIDLNLSSKTDIPTGTVSNADDSTLKTSTANSKCTSQIKMINKAFSKSLLDRLPNTLINKHNIVNTNNLKQKVSHSILASNCKLSPTILAFSNGKFVTCSNLAINKPVEKSKNQIIIPANNFKSIKLVKSTDINQENSLKPSINCRTVNINQNFHMKSEKKTP